MDTLTYTLRLNYCNPVSLLNSLKFSLSAPEKYLKSICLLQFSTEVIADCRGLPTVYEVAFLTTLGSLFQALITLIDSPTPLHGLFPGSGGSLTPPDEFVKLSPPCAGLGAPSSKRLLRSRKTNRERGIHEESDATAENVGKVQLSLDAAGLHSLLIKIRRKPLSLKLSERKLNGTSPRLGKEREIQKPD